MDSEGNDSLKSILADFGLAVTGEPTPLAGGLSGDASWAVPTLAGTVVVKRSVQPGREAFETAVADLSERLLRAGAPVSRYRRSLQGTFVVRRVSVQDFVAGSTRPAPTLDDCAAFGKALGVLDRALWRQPYERLFDRRPTVFARGKDPDWVLSRYLAACDHRFPKGYREEVLRIAHRLREATRHFGAGERVLVHVDGNPDNALFDDQGNVTLIDLTPEIRLPGYSLGAAVYWWAYPRATSRLDLRVLQTIASHFQMTARLLPRYREAVAHHVLTHSMMELALPLGCLVDGSPPDAEPLEDLEGRLARHTGLHSRFHGIRDALSAAWG